MGKRLFILAEGPLPGPTVSWQRAYGLRSWQLLSTLEDLEGWTVRLILLDDLKYYESAPEFSEWKSKKLFGRELECMYLNKDDRGFWRRLKQEFRSFDPELCLSINNLASFYMAKLRPSAPFWADLNGWLMGEGQSAAHAYSSNAYIKTLWSRETTILKHADQFSVVSSRQKDAIYGELAANLRLNQWTESWPFTAVIPNSNEIEKIDSDYKLDLPKNAKVVLFSGSYNTWLDEETLFKGIDAAMDKDENLFFVSTGGEVEGESNPVFRSFMKRVKSSKHKSRFQFLSWLSSGELHSLYSQVSLAINLDRDNAESYFGARNRINEWIRFDVPVFTTISTEVSSSLSEANACVALKFSDPKDLCEKISAHSHESLKEIASRAKDYANNHFSMKVTTAPLRHWLKTAEKAPDFGQRVQGGFFSKLRFRVRKDGIFFLVKWLWRKIK